MKEKVKDEEKLCMNIRGIYSIDEEIDQAFKMIKKYRKCRQEMP